MTPGRPGVVLTVDLGTGGPKVGLTTLDGRILWWEHTPVRTTVGPGGASTQDAELWWRLVRESARRVVDHCADATGGDTTGADVAAVAVTGQWASTVPVDAHGIPVGPCVMWDDTRGGVHTRRALGGPVQGYAPRALGTFLRRAGGVPNLSGADPLGHMLHLQAEGAGDARWFLEPVDYLTTRLTGRATASHASMTAAWLTDNRDLDRLAYDERLVALSGVDPTRLPPLVRTGSVIGSVLPDVAADLGIPADARVVTGLPDLHAAAVGSGCVGVGEAHLSIGTSAWVSAPLTSKRTDVVRQLASVPGVTPGHYLLGNNQDSAGRCLAWFRESLASGPMGEAPSFEELLAEAASVPAGANGVVFTPWLTGERCPVDDRAARAGFHNLGVSTTRRDLARAVLEGVALNARWMLSGSERFLGGRLEPIRLVGGGARSDLWCQILADALDREVVRVSDPFLAGLRGMALTAGMSLGVLGVGDVRRLVPTDPPFRPGPDRAVYTRLGAEVPRLYRAQKGFFRRMNAP